MKISEARLKEIIESHEKWLRNEEGGERADLQGANLQDAYLRGADLPDGVYQVVGCGSENRVTTYDTINDKIICGCWNDNNGNHFAAFKQRIADIYGENGKTPNEKYYAEYMAAIAFFEAIKTLYR